MSLEIPADSQPDLQAIQNKLRQVVDPELGVNIVDLGLVYRIAPGPDKLLIEMTMTSPACPMGEMIQDDVKSTLATMLPDHYPVEIHLVWEPPWDPSMMDDRVKGHFGW